MSVTFEKLIYRLWVLSIFSGICRICKKALEKASAIKPIVNLL